jgi:hypothetical protein
MERSRSSIRSSLGEEREECRQGTEEEQRHFKEINDRYARGVASLTIRPHIIN